MRDSDHVNTKALEGLMHSFDRVIGKHIGIAEPPKAKLGVVPEMERLVDKVLHLTGPERVYRRALAFCRSIFRRNF